jgi:lipopolysaccharide heptosyltransferase III
MRLLFIKLKHIGDALILTPTLAAARAAHPSALIWVVVRKGCEGILAGCPAIDRVLVSAAPEKSKRNPSGWLDDFKLLRELRRQHFDYAFELTNGDRGRLLTAWSGARFRCANDGAARVPIFWRMWFNKISRRDWTDEHQVEANFNFVKEFLPLGAGEPPPLGFEREFAAPSELQKKLHGYIVIHPGTRWRRKRWPQEKWVEAGRELLKLAPQLVISTGPDADEIQLAENLVTALGARAVSTRGQLSWAQLAGLLYGAKLFVGVDTAAMHLAAACQCPTVAIFGDTVAKHWRPWRVSHRLVLPSVRDGSQIDRAELIRHVPVSGVVTASRELVGGNSEFRIVSTSPNS